MPILGQPKQGWEEFTGGKEDGGVVLLEWTLCLLFLGTSVSLLQHAALVALSSGVGRGMPVPTPPEHE